MMSAPTPRAVFGFWRMGASCAACFRVLIARRCVCYSDRRLTARYGIVAQRKMRGGVKGTSSVRRLRFLTYLSWGGGGGRSVTGDYLDVLRVIAQRYLYPISFSASAVVTRMERIPIDDS